MTETLELLGRPEYQHALLCHIPLLGLLIALLVLGVALALDNRPMALTGLVLIAVTAALAWPAVESGEAAYNRLQAGLDAESAAVLKEHMETAEPWAVLYYVTAATALVTALWGRKRPQRFWVSSLVVVALAVLSLVAGLAIAKSGGRVRHPEFRTRLAGPQPADDTLGTGPH